MTYVMAVLAVLAAALLAAGASWVVGRRVTVESRRRHHEVGGPVFAQFGVLLSVLVAFVFSEVLSEYRTAAEAINGECGALSGAAMLASTLPDGRGKPINRAIATYANSVVTLEWPAMAKRQHSPRAEHDFEAIVKMISRATMAIGANSVRDRILALVLQAHEQRETRTFQLTRSMPDFAWVMLIVIFAVQLSFIVFAGVENPINMIFAASFAGCTVLVFVLVQMLDFPFEGALALSDADFRGLCARVIGLMT